MDAMQLCFPLPMLCRVLGVSASGYHAWRVLGTSRRSREDQRLKVEIRAAHRRTRQTYGPKRLQNDLADHGMVVGVHRIKRLRRKLGLRCIQKRRFKATTDSRRGLPVADNVLGQRIKTTGPGQAWVSDITYIPTDEGWLYVAGHKDTFTRMIVGFAMEPRMTKNLVSQSLFRALSATRLKPGLIHHSDRGSQYCAHEWSEVERYIGEHSEAQFSHSVCPDCMRKLYPEVSDEILGCSEKDETI